MTSSNAMAAKAKAMYGERLRANDYQTLLQKKTISDIASFLKNTKLYGDSLEGINVKGIHRGQLELLLRMDVYDRQDALMRYASSVSRKYTTVSVMQTEMQLILMCVRSFEDDSMARDLMIARMPLYMEKDATFDIKKLADVHDYDALLALLKSTVYYNPLRRFRPEKDMEMDYAGLEHQLNLVYYDTVLNMIDTLANGEEKDEIRTIVLAQVELENIAILYRLKKYFNVSVNEMRKMMTPKYCYFKPYEIDDMIRNCDADEVVERLEKRYGRYLKDTKFTFIEHYIKVIRFNMNLHYLQFSTAPNTVLIAYFILSEIEIQNVIEIVEGVRYGVSQDRIRSLLVF